MDRLELCESDEVRNLAREVSSRKYFLITVTVFSVGFITVYLTLLPAKTLSIIAPVRVTNIISLAALHNELSIHREALERRKYVLSSLSSSKATRQVPVCQTNITADDKQTEMNSLKLVCYYTFPNNNDLDPDKIDPFLCTHINIASLGIIDNKLEAITEDKQKVIQSVVSLKVHNKYLKILLCVGGDPHGFAEMVSKWASRKMFIEDLLTVLSHYSFDGVDFDWEFPAWPGKITERSKFVIFLKELQTTISEKRLSLIVSAAVAAPRSIVEVSYYIPEMSRYIDYVNIMTYDFHFYTKYLPVTGPNAPLYSLPGDKGYFSTLNTNWSSTYWHEKGMPKEKIIVGIPTYGHSYRLMNADNHGWSAPATGFGNTGTGGFVSYPDVCQFLQINESAYEFDETVKVPYTYKELEWISYEDVCSVMYKAKYIISGTFGGAMVFSLNEDDHKGQCSGTEFLLTRQIKIILRMSDSDTKTLVSVVG